MAEKGTIMVGSLLKGANPFSVKDRLIGVSRQRVKMLSMGLSSIAEELCSIAIILLLQFFRSKSDSRTWRVYSRIIVLGEVSSSMMDVRDLCRK